MTGTSRRIAVVGAGPAGLTAAWELSKAGAAVTLYERRDRPGGWLRTEALDGVPGDVAAQLLGSYFRETLRLTEEVGAADLLVRAPGRDALWRGGRAHPISYGSPASMAASGALPTGLKLRLVARYLPFLRRHAAILDPNDPARAAALDRESIGEWGRRELGDDFVELLVYPQLAAYYGATPEETGAGFYHTLAHAGLEIHLHAVRGGLGELAAAIARGLERRGVGIRAGEAVRSVRVVGDGVEVETDAGGESYEATVVALPAATALDVAALDGPAREWLAAVRSNGAVSLALAVEGQRRPGYFGLSFPRVEPPGERVVACCFQAAKDAGLAAGPWEMVVVYPAPALVPRLLSASSREVLELLTPAVDRALSGTGSRIVRARVYRYPAAGTLYYPGYLEHLRRFDPGWLSPRIALAGDYLVAPTIEGAVRSGRRAAARLLGG